MIAMCMGIAKQPAWAGRTDTTAFATEGSRAWTRHWLSLPRDTVVPVRSVFDPMAVPSLLPHMLICDLSEPGIVRVRLMGTGLVRSFGFDPTGRDYLELVEPARRESAYDGFTVPAGQPCGMRVLGENRYGNGEALTIETVGFPFRRDDGAGMQMVFVGSRLDERRSNWPNQGTTASFHVFEREFIDVGAGIP